MDTSILKFESKEVRLILSNGEPQWIAKDVCDALDLKNHTRSMMLLDDDEKGAHIVSTLGGPQELATVNEAGLYSLILRSRKPEAKRFKRWITHEVLPSLRKTGVYIVPGDSENSVANSALQILGQFQQFDSRLARLEENVLEAKELTRDLPEPMGVLPGFTNSKAINRAARAYCQLTGCSPSALMASIYTELEFRFGIRLTVRKKKAGWTGSTLSFGIESGYGDRIYNMIHRRLQRALEDLAA